MSSSMENVPERYLHSSGRQLAANLPLTKEVAGMSFANGADLVNKIFCSHRLVLQVLEKASPEGMSLPLLPPGHGCGL
jgi:hypothetical protein